MKACTHLPLSVTARNHSYGKSRLAALVMSSQRPYVPPHNQRHRSHHDGQYADYHHQQSQARRSYDQDSYTYGQERYASHWDNSHAYPSSHYGYDQSMRPPPSAYPAAPYQPYYQGETWQEYASGSSIQHYPQHAWYHQNYNAPDSWHRSQSNSFGQGRNAYDQRNHSYADPVRTSRYHPAERKSFHSYTSTKKAHDARHKGGRYEHSHRPEPAIRAAPRDSYLRQAASRPATLSREEAVGRKLLVVLDLNGTLVYRTKGESGRAVASKKACPRPYLSCFLQYCLGTDTTVASRRSVPEAQRPHGTHFWDKDDTGAFQEPETQGQAEVVVWSSAQPVNVNSMVVASFDAPLRARISRVWARDTLVAPRFYRSKADSVKDLEIIWAELNLWHNGMRSSTRLLADARDCQDRERPDDGPQSEPISAALESALQAAELGPWGAHNTVLVDDSPLKARLQPYNQLTVPEFGGKAAQIMKRYIQQQSAVASDANNSESEDQARITASPELLTKASTIDGSVSTDIRGKKPVAESKLDDVLLQTIGVLETLRYQRDVSSFIHLGGIKGYGGDKTHVEERATQQGSNEGNTPEYWANLGRRACQQLGIDVRPWTPRLSPITQSGHSSDQPVSTNNAADSGADQCDPSQQSS